MTSIPILPLFSVFIRTQIFVHKQLDSLNQFDLCGRMAYVIPIYGVWHLAFPVSEQNGGWRRLSSFPQFSASVLIRSQSSHFCVASTLQLQPRYLRLTILLLAREGRAKENCNSQESNFHGPRTQHCVALSLARSECGESVSCSAVSHTDTVQTLTKKHTTAPVLCYSLIGFPPDRGSSALLPYLFRHSICSSSYRFYPQPTPHSHTS